VVVQGGGNARGNIVLLKPLATTNGNVTPLPRRLTDAGSHRALRPFALNVLFVLNGGALLEPCVRSSFATTRSAGSS